MQIKRAQSKSDLRLVRALDAICFPRDDRYPTQRAEWWLAWDDGEPVGYSGIKYLPSIGVWFLCRIGVLFSHRGSGLARRLTMVRLGHAKRWGPEAPIITYCTNDNMASANNLISCGFKLYTPEEEYGAPHALYWMKT